MEEVREKGKKNIKKLEKTFHRNEITEVKVGVSFK
jgi:hypothetical protein